MNQFKVFFGSDLSRNEAAKNDLFCRVVASEACYAAQHTAIHNNLQPQSLLFVYDEEWCEVFEVQNNFVVVRLSKKPLEAPHDSKAI